MGPTLNAFESANAMLSSILYIIYIFEYVPLGSLQMEQYGVKVNICYGGW